LFLLLAVFWTPRTYHRLDDKKVIWTETLVSPIWKHSTTKYTAYQVPVGLMMVPREELSGFRAMTLSQRMDPKPGSMKVPVVERNYVMAGWDVTVLAGYALLALAAGAVLAVLPLGRLLGPLGAAASGLLASVLQGSRRAPPPPATNSGL
jgi:hypothetical protein